MECNTLFTQLILLQVQQSPVQIEWLQHRAKLEAKQHLGQHAAIKITLGNKSTTIDEKTASEFLKQIFWLDPKQAVASLDWSKIFDRPIGDQLTLSKFKQTIKQHQVRKLNGIHVPNTCLD